MWRQTKMPLPKAIGCCATKKTQNNRQEFKHATAKIFWQAL